MIARLSMKTLILCSTLLLGLTSIASRAEVEMSLATEGEKTFVKQMSAEITAIDRETRDVTLEGPTGNTITMNAGEEIKRLDEFNVGDMVQVTYIEAISGDLREPSPEELANPWVELDAAAIAESDMPPGAAAGRVVQAVCTIEGMNRVTQTVTVRDPRGRYHIIGDVDPARMEGVTLGQTVIITYTEAVALTLEKQEG